MPSTPVTRGIIHRDLKPANTKITSEGQIKVLDYGLVKAFEPETSNQVLSESPTLTAAATRQGVILGTAPYMSPEQARGKTVDKRSDIFLFGAVLYEMLTGRSPFWGEDVSETLAAVIKSEPDWGRLPRELVPEIRRLLRGCLKKDTKERRRDMGDVMADIAEILQSPGSSVPTPPAQSGWRSALPWCVAAIAVVVALWALYGSHAEPAAQVVRSSINLPAAHEWTDVKRVTWRRVTCFTYEAGPCTRHRLIRFASRWRARGFR